VTEERNLLAYLSKSYPLGVRVLPDGSFAALYDLLYTRAILLGCDRYGYARRFCFEDRALASRRFEELHSEDDEPQGYTDKRPETP